MKLRFALPLLACLALPVSAANPAAVEPQASMPEESVTEAEPATEIPPEMWGVYGRNNYACRARGMDVPGKLGIRGDRIIIEGQPYDVGEIHQVTNRQVIAQFVAPGGWTSDGVRMGFYLLRKNKVWHTTYDGKPSAKIGYVRCRNR